MGRLWTFKLCPRELYYQWIYGHQPKMGIELAAAFYMGYLKQP